MQKKGPRVVYTAKGEGEESKTSNANGATTTSRVEKDGDKKPPAKIPGRYKIAPSDDPEFNLETCMENFKFVENPYEKDSDYYFDSYSHFHIHEDMLKDRVSTSYFPTNA